MTQFDYDHLRQKLNISHYGWAECLLVLKKQNSLRDEILRELNSACPSWRD